VTVSQAGTKRELPRGIEVHQGETDMAEAAHSQVGAERRRNSKVPEILPAPVLRVQAPLRAKRGGFGSRILVISRVIVIAIAALLVGSWYWLYERQYEDADDAQIEGSIGVVSSAANSTTTERGPVR
jgi:hypothetical protein